MSDLTAKDLHWFKIANSNPAPGFYDFKARFLRRFATPAGFDKQEIERFCWTCDGSGQYMENVECNRCGGTGIYDVATHWLQRWDLHGQIYHRPMDHADVWHLHNYRWPEPVHLIEGRISHSQASYSAAKRAFYRLLLRHEPVRFYQQICSDLASRWHHGRVKWVWCLIRLRNKMDLFRPIPEHDFKESDVPF